MWWVAEDAKRLETGEECNSSLQAEKLLPRCSSTNCSKHGKNKNLLNDLSNSGAAGDRIQFTAPFKDEHIANRQLGTIDKIDAESHLHIRLDSGRDVDLNLRDHRHLDYGYAVTSHSGQSATADRVLVHVDTETAHERLINSRLAYVAISRGRYDAQIFTNDAAKLADELSHDVCKHSAIGNDQSGTNFPEAERNPAEEISPGGEPVPAQAHAVSESHGHGMER